MDLIQDQCPLEYVFGVRHPLSERYTRDSAVVFSKIRSTNTIIATVFRNGADVSGYLSSEKYNNIVVQYNAYIRMGWKKMDKDDLAYTTGMIINRNTMLAPYNKNYVKKAISITVIGSFTLMAIRCIMKV